MTDTPPRQISREFTASNITDRPPLTFKFADQLFHIPSKQRPDVAIYLAAAAQLQPDGTKLYPYEVLRRCLIDMLAAKLPNDAGEWEPVDDKQRFVDLLRSDEWEITADQLGAIVEWVSEELTADPIGASRR